MWAVRKGYEKNIEKLSGELLLLQFAQVKLLMKYDLELLKVLLLEFVGEIGHPLQLIL